MNKMILALMIAGAAVAACTNEAPTAESPKLTRDNFATAETHRYFQEFTDQGAINKFVHEEDLVVALDQQTIIRSNIDITENWTYVLRMYGPQEPILNGTYKPVSPQLVE